MLQLLFSTFQNSPQAPRLIHQLNLPSFRLVLGSATPHCYLIGSKLSKHLSAFPKQDISRCSCSCLIFILLCTPSLRLFCYWKIVFVTRDLFDYLGVMTDQQDHEGRPLKRQKLDVDILNIPFATAHSGYICLATRCVHISSDDTDIYKALYKNETFCEAEILELLEQSEPPNIRLKIPSLKTTSNFDVSDWEPADAAFIANCLKLPSTTSTSKKAPENPLAKCFAKLDMRDSKMVLDVSVLWQDSVYAREKVDRDIRDILLQSTLQNESSVCSEAAMWDVKEFYENVHVPITMQQEPLKLDLVQCKLYPFQDRATRWMLSREGVKALPSGQVVANDQASLDLPLDFQQTVDMQGSPCYFSSSLGIVSSSATDIVEKYGHPRGGVLAEAMGLGKTVEMIALMCSHTKQKSPLNHSNPEKLHETGATLIITPPTILEQWKEELREHAPSLRVFHYTGMKAKSKWKDDQLQTLTDQDVVLTTYNAIASELYFVQEAPDRNLRTRPRRRPPKSPLTQILWWRCLLDEAQMVESGVSHAAIVARLIPRIHAWAVTGTPLKQSHRDLHGLMLFLRYEPWCQSTRLWDYLVFYRRDLFRKLIQNTTLRHSKEHVRNELRIPPQSRKVVTIPFTAVEESHYAQLHYDMQQEVGLNSAGEPIDGEWDPENPVTVEKMRTWLQRLRQTCLHPEVGGRNRRALGKKGGGPLRTVAQVLEVMIEQNDSVVHTEQRNALMARVDQARLLEHARKSEQAQEMFTTAYSEASTFVDDCRKDLMKELEKTTGKVPLLEGEGDIEPEEDEDVETALTTARQRLRSALEVQHICIFFIGNTHFQLKEKLELKLSLTDQPTNLASGVSHNVSEADEVADSKTPATKPDSVEEGLRAEIASLEKLETEAYEEAKKIRTELLTEAYRKAQRRIKSIRAKKESSTFALIPLLEYSEKDFGGIESRKIFEKLYHYCKAMNAQAEQYKEMRAKMAELLSQVLIDEEEGVVLTGEEYEDSTKHQDEIYVVMEMLRALFADRSDAISGQENLLLKQETRQFLRDAKEGKGHAPELMVKLLAERQEKRINPTQQGSLRGIVTEIRSLASSLEWQEGVSARARSELVIVNEILKHVQKLQTEQVKSVSALEQEVNLLRDTMNARLDYYRALQVISDMVRPIGKDEDVGKPVDSASMTRVRQTEAAATKKLSVATSKRRYLLHLKNEQETEGEAKICTICQFEFEVGTLTVCGHQFCKECIQMWWSQHRNCPVCKRHLHLADFYDVTYKPTETIKEPEEQQGEENRVLESTSQTNSIYTSVSASTLQQIRSIDLQGSSFGSKVDTLVRHILHLRRSDPGSKSIIFSQYRDFLDVLSRSLRDNSVIHSKFDEKDGIIDFKSNPANECFLLHAKAHAAGLNLVCASHVILCEPLINTAIELQAVARVHRIGQLRETCVWMYLIEGTVEEAIYDISVRRRLAHIDSRSRESSRAVSRAVSPSRGEVAIEVANAKELQAADLSKMFAAGKAGGEIVDKDDLWGCLFGNAGNRAAARRGPSRGLADLGIGHGLDGSAVGASSEVGRFLRTEAAVRRRAT